MVSWLRDITTGVGKYAESLKQERHVAMAELGRFEKAAQKVAEDKTGPNGSWNGVIVPVSPGNGPGDQRENKSRENDPRGEAATKRPAMASTQAARPKRPRAIVPHNVEYARAATWWWLGHPTSGHTHTHWMRICRTWIGFN